MNDQLSRRDTMIDSLNRELEKEREHNREKDRQLLDTLTKLAETQAALAAGQSAEKQKALAETLIEGKQMMDGSGLLPGNRCDLEVFSCKKAGEHPDQSRIIFYQKQLFHSHTSSFSYIIAFL